ncbi:tetratricopeptide repeat protein [Streptomyces angustmyceticus]|uniref:ATP-binding protein n=1 Tax=Streptomyces angustmyceticus TaxID=285578 RepID=UPI00117BEF87|nr:tetratricopeptide repeat protein [Streptomyces angustmyceticus]UAL65966.1 ATP-binding protein [Streptomyces angustmyceticus]
MRLTEPVPCTVAWQGDAGLDAALLRLSAEGLDMSGAPAVPEPRWAEVTGAEPVAVAVTGMSAAAARSTGDGTETETVRGVLDPLTYTRSDRYAVDVSTAWPAGWDQWSGMSGSAVVHKSGALLGVVAWSDRPYEGRRLTAVPVRALLADPGFRGVLREMTGQDALLRALDPERPVESVRLTAGSQLATAAVRTTLKAPPRRIVDREAERHRLPELVAGNLTGRPELVHAIVGMPGVGKSALARYLAHQLAADFPDAQFELDLYGHTPDRAPLNAQAAMEALLTWAGICGDNAPNLDAKAALWRNWLHGRRGLLLLDNAESLEQVACLLPGDDSSLVLITSRVALHDPDRITLTELDVLPADEAVRLLIESAGVQAEEATDPALEEICRACGFLPLAVQAVAVRLRFEEPEELLSAMRETDSPLLEIPDADRRVGAAFAVSWQALEAADPLQAGLLRVLAMHPGPELEVEACAAMTGMTARECRRRMADLATKHLVQRQGRGRFGFHDLFLAYARSLAMAQEPQERWDEVLDRLFTHFLSRGEAAQVALTASTGDPGVARTWLDRERTNLIAVTVAAVERRSPQARRLAAMTHALLGRLGATTELARIWSTMRDTAETDHDRPSRADALCGLADTERRSGDLTTARDNYQVAADLYEALGDRRGQADALWGLAETERARSRYEDARALFLEARRSYEELDDRAGLADTYWGLANVAVSLGRYERGAEEFRQARELYAGLGDRRGQAQAIRGLADIARNRGRGYEAHEGYHAALATYEEIGDVRGQAQSLRGLGHVARVDGRHEEAADLFVRARDLSRRIGDRRGEADMLRGLGDVQRLRGNYAEAREMLTRSAEVHRDLDNAGGLGFTLRALGDTERADGRPDRARAAYDEARAAFHRVGSRRGLADTLCSLAGVLPPGAEARAAYTEALALYEGLGADTTAARCRERLAELDRASQQGSDGASELGE